MRGRHRIAERQLYMSAPALPWVCAASRARGTPVMGLRSASFSISAPPQLWIGAAASRTRGSFRHSYGFVLQPPARAALPRCAVASRASGSFRQSYGFVLQPPARAALP